METNRRRHAMSGQKHAVLFAALLVLTMAALIGVNSAPELSAAPSNSQAPASALRASGFASGPDRDVSVSNVKAQTGKVKGHVDLTANVQIKNTGPHTFNVAQGEFYLSALGDALGHVVSSTGAISGSSVAQGATVAGGLTFDIPADAEPYVVLVDRPATGASPVSVPLGVNTPASAVAGISYLSNASSASTTSGNTIEDNFQRANQSGWGTSTNTDGVSNVTWGMDGAGLASVKIASDTGVYGYPGATNQVGIASAGSAAYNGGDVLARLSVSAVGQVIPYVTLDACADKSCYYGARIQTSVNHLELARRSGGSTGVMASVPFTASANTVYWLRLQVTPGSPTQIEAKVWANGTPEPAWMVSASDSAPLAANRVGAGGSWDATGTGESINYTCFAYASSGLASACGAGSGGGTPTPTPTPTNTPTPTPTNTPTPTPTNTPTNTPTPTPTNTPTNTPTPSPTPAPTLNTFYLNNGGVGEPWGTAIDSAGNVWFAEPGCDFAPTCSSSTPPGQIGELPAGSSTAKFWTLPNVTGNQPIFVALDGSGNVWFTTPNNSMIGEFSPSTQKFVGQWAVTANTGPWDLTFNNGKIWFTEHLVSAIGEFDPSTHTYKDFQTPSSGSLPYGIAGNDPANSNLVWFAENADTVGKIGVMNTSTNTITEYSIQAQPQSGLTPHMITIDSQGNPWWTEGWVRSVGKLTVSAANPSSCGVSAGDCNGVTEIPLGAPGTTCSGVHISGITIPAGGSTIWVTDALQSQVIALTPSTGATSVTQLASCGAHPHDGLNHDPSSNIWWDEEFANALGELIP